jgi:YhcH/YjgK/YiaL family protein
VVIDQLANAHLHRPLGPRITRALDFLLSTDPTRLELGRHDIDGDNVYALVSEYRPKRQEEGRWEAHRRYIDLQCVASGRERVGFAPLDRLTPEPYDEAKDIMRLEGAGDFLTLEPGQFMLLWPGDAHMPGIAIGEPVTVKKVVVKIRLADP